MKLSLSIGIAAGMLAFLCLLAGSSYSDDGAGFRSVTGPCHFEFPKDHGAHPGYQTEWWYYTGNLTAETGERFGFQLTFFRRQLKPSDAKGQWPRPASAWRSNQIFLAHAALTDVSARRHEMAEKVSRAGLGMAGAVTNQNGVRIFLHDWETLIVPDGHTLRADTPDFDLELTLVPTKEPVAHGNEGYSRKGSLPEQASCYYSFSRMTANCRVRTSAIDYTVSGLGWMDHEYSTAPLAEGIAGWDWFSIQLDDHRELMFFFLRQKTGGIHPASSGTLVGTQGEGLHLTLADIQTQVTHRWTSPTTGATYPLGWTFRLPGQELDLELTATVDDQEMVTSGSTGVTYWEGSVTVSGRTGKEGLAGRGYMELTGYADPNAPPL